MGLIIGGIAAAAAAAYALWMRLVRRDAQLAHAKASQIRVGADLLISVARTVSWIVRLITGEVAGPVSTPGQREAPPGPQAAGFRTVTIPNRIGQRAGDLQGEPA